MKNQSPQISNPEPFTNWAARRQDFIEKEHAVATTILETCQKSLAERINTTNLRDVACLLEMASKLGRLSCGLAAEETAALERERSVKNDFLTQIKNYYAAHPHPAGTAIELGPDSMFPS